LRYYRLKYSCDFIFIEYICIILQRFFGIVRSIDDKPTAHSWLHIFRILSLYTPTKIHVQRGNVDNEEELRILVKYQQCLVNKFKENEKEAADIRQSFKDKLLSELSIRYVDEMPNIPIEEVQDGLIYNVCGYLLHTRKSVLDCEACRKGMITKLEDLPETFLPVNYTEARSRGGLKYATENFFKVFQLVEVILSNQFEKESHVFIKDSYEIVMDRICELNLSNPCCESHPECLPFLIMEYVRIRYHFESKRYRNLYFSKEHSQNHSNMKKSKLNIK
jgi:hypothetical protein